MSNTPKIYKYKTLKNLISRFRDDLKTQDFVLLYAYNGTGKTRISMEFKDRGKRQRGIERDTLYFNAFTEDLFSWDNDLENDSKRALKINSDSKFFKGFKDLALEDRIFSYLERYATFNFNIDYKKWKITFSQEVRNPRYRAGNGEPETIIQDHIKVSRGEENIFIWCVFLAVCELTIDRDEAYDWVKFLYIDDPVSSLDDNNVIAVASDLAKLLRNGNDRDDGSNQLKTVISSHHGLFFNVMCNELKKTSHKRYFLHRHGLNGYSLRATDDMPHFHHVAMLSELQQASESGEIYTHHFNTLRSILEKTATFFGFSDFSDCIQGIDDEVLYSRALNLLSHGQHSVYEPVEMGDDNKELFRSILSAFQMRYEFALPDMLNNPTNTES